MKHELQRILNWHIHVVSGWFLGAMAKSVRDGFEQGGLCAVWWKGFIVGLANCHQRFCKYVSVELANQLFDLKHGVFVFKAEGRENNLKIFVGLLVYPMYTVYIYITIKTNAK